MTRERRWRNAGESEKATEIWSVLRLLCEWPCVAMKVEGESNASMQETS